MKENNFCPQILSKDSVTVFVNAIMYYKVMLIKITTMIMMMMFKVEDAVRAISNVDDYAGSAKALAATTLRSITMKMIIGEGVKKYSFF